MTDVPLIAPVRRYSVQRLAPEFPAQRRGLPGPLHPQVNRATAVGFISCAGGRQIRRFARPQSPDTRSDAPARWRVARGRSGEVDLASCVK